MKEKDVLILFKQPHLNLMKVITRSQARSLIFNKMVDFYRNFHLSGRNISVLYSKNNLVFVLCLV